MDASRWLAVVPAAGSAQRMGRDKVLAALGDRPVLTATLQALREAGLTRIAVGVRPGAADTVRARAITPFGLDGPGLSLVSGGSSRQETVWNCVNAVTDTAYVLVHDAARPFCSPALIRAVAAAAGSHGAAIAGLPLVDTLHEVRDGFVTGTPDRAIFYRAQTPQAFRRDVLVMAHRAARARGLCATDDAQLVREAGGSVRVVPGEESNRKITVPADLPDPSGPVSVGWGTDIHRLVAGRPLILGGVHIPYDRGLLGHSDADVLCHALADAILGASGLGDIGQHFPPDDPQYAGADSTDLLRQCVAKARQAGWQVLRGDSTVLAERPRLADHISAMRASLAAALDIPPEAVNVKAGTNEGFDAVGRGEAISAHAVIVLGRSLLAGRIE